MMLLLPPTTCLQDLWSEIVIKGIWTCDLWVSVLIRSYRRAMVGVSPEFPGQLIASLLVAQCLVRWCTSLVVQVRSLACLVKSHLLQGGKPLNDAAATYHLFVYYMSFLNRKCLALQGTLEGQETTWWRSKRNKLILIECPPDTEIFSKRRKIYSICVEGMSCCLRVGFYSNNQSAIWETIWGLAFLRCKMLPKVNQQLTQTRFPLDVCILSLLGLLAKIKV